MVDVEPASELHIDQTKIKNVSLTYETMAGNYGNTITAYVLSAAGNTAGNPEVRFVTEGTEGSTKVAYGRSVTRVHYWYKLTNSSEKNAADVSSPYLMQVLDSQGTYPIREWTPTNDGQWHEQFMDVEADYYNRFAGFIIKAGDLNGTITVAEIQLITTTEPASELHLDQTKIKNVTMRYETMAGHNGNQVDTYVASASGNTAGNPEYRFVTAGTEGGTKVAYSKAVEQVHFWYKVDNDSEKNAADAAVPYLLQVLDSEGTYPIREWTPVNDGLWHEWTMDVQSSFYNQFAGFLVKAGDLDGTFTIAEIQLLTSAEEAGDLHLDLAKVQRVDYHFEWLTNHDASKKVAAYVFEGDGDLYPNPGVNDYMPEMRFMNASSGGSTKIASDPAVKNVHFWYKITNTADVATHDSENDGYGYCIEVVKAPSGYPIYTFEPVVDGAWHEFTLNVAAADQAAFAGIIVQAGDLNGSIAIAELEINKAVATDTEAPGVLHLDLAKVQRVDHHFEWVTGHDGDLVNAYVFEGNGGLYPEPGVNDYMPEMRFMNASSGGSTKVASDPAVENVYFWYKISNAADLSEHHSQNGTDPYNLQVVGAPSGYYDYTFHAVADGEWHQFKLNILEEHQNKFAGFILQAGDLDGYIMVADLQVNVAYTDLDLLEASSADQLEEGNLIANIGLWDSGHTKNAVKNFDQTADTLVYKKDANTNTGIYFSKTGSTANGEFRVYLPDNAYKNETKGYAMTQFTFDYMYKNDGSVVAHNRNPGLTSDGYFVAAPAEGTVSNNFTVQALLHNNSVNMYYDIEVTLINDGNLHSVTLNLAYGDVVGFGFKLWDLQGEFFMSNAHADYLEYNANLDAMYGLLKMYDSENDGSYTSCADYYDAAKAGYLALSEGEKALFNTNASYASARARLAAWAVANGETFDAANGTFSAARTNPVVNAIQNNNTIIIVVASTIALIAVAGIFVLRRKQK